MRKTERTSPVGGTVTRLTNMRWLSELGRIRLDQRRRNLAVFHNLRFHTFNTSMRACSTQICPILYNELWSNCMLWWEKGVITVFENNLHLMGQYTYFMAFLLQGNACVFDYDMNVFHKGSCEFWLSKQQWIWVKRVLLFSLSFNTFKLIKNLPWHL